jgi:hypothetical protein
MKTSRHISNLEHIASLSDSGFLDACRQAGTSQGNGLHEVITIDRADLEALLSRFHSSYKLPAPARPDPPLPPFRRRLQNAAKAAGRFIKALICGDPRFVSKRETRRRQSICRDCEWYRPSDQHCSKCGCPLARRWLAKTQMATEHCPLPKPKW